LYVSPVAQPAYPDATSELVRNNTPVSEGAEPEVEAKAANGEEVSDIEIFEYKLKLLKID
jgi:phage head maturation protease